MTDVARLEALLARVQENRTRPRPPRADVSPATPAAAVLPESISLDSKDDSSAIHAHATIQGIPAPTIPQAPAPVPLEPVVAPLFAAPLLESPVAAREPEPLDMMFDDALPAAAAPLAAFEPEPFAAEASAPDSLAAEADAPATREADEPLLSVLPAAFDEGEEFEEAPPSRGFDELDEPDVSLPPAALVPSAAPPATANLAAQPIPPGAISPPSEPIARLAAPLSEPAPATFGGLLRRTLALRPR